MRFLQLSMMENVVQNLYKINYSFSQKINAIEMAMELEDEYRVKSKIFYNKDHSYFKRNRGCLNQYG